MYSKDRDVAVCHALEEAFLSWRDRYMGPGHEMGMTPFKKQQVRPTRATQLGLDFMPTQPPHCAFVTLD